MMKRAIKNMLGWRQEMSISFYLIDFIFRKLLRQNGSVKWAVHHTSTIHCADRITKGVGTFPGDSPNVYINAYNGVSIGDYTNLGPKVSIVSANHDFIDNSKTTSCNPISIGRYNWFGAGSVILPGVILGDFTIVGAGAVVTKSFESGYCVIAGNPAKIIKLLDKEACIAFATRHAK